MNKLVIDHSYALGMAWDKSRFRNHGVLHKVAPGTGDFNGALSFAKGRGSPGSLVVIPPSSSLQRIGAVRVRAQIYMDPQGRPRRHNIVEGHLSFALAVQPDLSLRGSFWVPRDRWIGIQTPPGTVVPRRWTLVEYWYDGVCNAEILVNGTRVASSFDATALHSGPLSGPVSGIGPLGVFVGHWAAMQDLHTFDGYIRRVQVYKRDDIENLLKLIDPCCMPDMKYWHELINRLEKRGYTPKAGRNTLDQMMAQGAEVMVSITNGNEQRTTELQQLLRQYLYAVKFRRNGVPIEPPVRRLLKWILEHATSEQLEAARNMVSALREQLPMDQRELGELAQRMCFGSMKENIEKEVRRLAEDPEWQARIRKRFGG